MPTINLGNIKGEKGDPGLSAYQGWLALGNVGTEDEYQFSLKGIKGDQGDPGGVVADDSITPEKTNFIRLVLMNIFNKDTVTVGSYINNWGEINTGAGFDLSDYMPVVAGKSYASTSTYACAFYNASHIYISGIAEPTNPILAPANAAFVRQTFWHNDIGTSMFRQDTLPPVYCGYNVSELQWKIPQYSSDMANSLLKTPSFYQGYSPLRGLKYCALGDSITSGLTATIPYGQVIANKYGIDFVNYGYSGSKIIQTASETDAMCVRYTTMPNDADIITVMGGTNDDGNNLPLGTMADRIKTTFYGACHVLFSGLIVKYPGKRIGIITPISKVTGDRAKMLTYVNVIKEVAAYYSLPVLDMWNGGGLDATILQATHIPDGLHPNDLGHEIIARHIYSFLLTL